MKGHSEEDYCSLCEEEKQEVFELLTDCSKRPKCLKELPCFGPLYDRNYDCMACHLCDLHQEGRIKEL